MYSRNNFWVLIFASLTNPCIGLLLQTLQGVLRDGTQVAVKSLSAGSKQGTDEFLTEINIISNTRHPNLVKLIGCCVEGNHRILVYEYLENNSLANSLLGNDPVSEVFC